MPIKLYNKEKIACVIALPIEKLHPHPNPLPSRERELKFLPLITQ
jgi:hypothetical protein